MAEDSIFKPDYPRGEHRDVCFGPDGRVIWETPWQHNVITNALRPLVAALVKGDPMPTLSHWAVGTGLEAWDRREDVPSIGDRQSRTELYSEVARKPIQDNVAIRAESSNELEINITFNLNDFPDSTQSYQLREFGIFAGGSETANSGTLINHRTHASFDMEVGNSVVRTLRLIF